MAEKKGVARLRRAAENQATAGEACFSLPIGEATAICDECEDELASLSWAKGVPAPVDADGNVVPLTTKVMYFGDSPRDVIGFHYNADNSWELYTTTLYTLLSTFNLRRPDSWERLEEDINSIKDAACPCDYFNHPDCGMPCYSCPAHTDAEDCIAELARDVLRRARKLAERDAKGAGRG